MPAAFAYGPWALVTGASSGIGEQFAHLLAAAGCHLVITARRAEQLHNLATTLQAEHGIQVEAVTLDLNDADFLAPLLKAIAGKDIGLLVSNAGFGLKGPHAMQDGAQLQAMLNVNALAPMLLTNALAPQLCARDKSGIILTSSIEGFVPFPHSAAYAASKAFVLSLGEAIAWELKAEGVDTLVLCPGSTDTEALTRQGFDPATLKGLMSPRDVASQALDALGKKTVLVTGTANKAMVKLLRNLPRNMAVNLAGKAMQSATGGASKE